MREALEEIFNIKITDEDLFKKALTHPSFTKENNLNSLDKTKVRQLLPCYHSIVLTERTTELLNKR